MTQLKHIITLIFLWAICALDVAGQTATENKSDKACDCAMTFDSTLNRSYYLIVDKMPTYRGGQDTLKTLISKNLKWPSPYCCMEVTVAISFIIESDGKVTNKRIGRSALSDDSICNPSQEALNVIDYLTDWTPGQCNGKKVAVRYDLPIRFSRK